MVNEFKSDEFSIKCADYLSKWISKFLLENEKINIALSGGTTPLPILNALKSFKLQWEKANFFLVDERVVQADSVESNFNNLKKFFFDYINSKSFILYNPKIGIEKSLSKYNKIIPEKFDLVILGMGQDGHIASLFPNTLALKETKKRYVTNKINGNSSRLTMTMPLLLDSKEIILIFKGSSKWSTFTSKDTSLPINILKKNFKNLIVLCSKT